MALDKWKLRRQVKARSWYHKMELAAGIETPGVYEPRPLLETMGFPEDLTGQSFPCTYYITHVLARGRAS